MHMMAVESVFAVDVDMHDRPDLESRGGTEIAEGETMVRELSKITETNLMQQMGQYSDDSDDDED